MNHAPACAVRPGWPLGRALFALAGTATLINALLVAHISPWFLLLTAFVAISQWLFVGLGACPASWLLSRLFGLQSARDTPTPQGVSR